MGQAADLVASTPSPRSSQWTPAHRTISSVEESTQRPSWQLNVLENGQPIRNDPVRYFDEKACTACSGSTADYLEQSFEFTPTGNRVELVLTARHASTQCASEISTSRSTSTTSALRRSRTEAVDTRIAVVPLDKAAGVRQGYASTCQANSAVTYREASPVPEEIDHESLVIAELTKATGRVRTAIVVPTLLAGLAAGAVLYVVLRDLQFAARGAHFPWVTACLSFAPLFGGSLKIAPRIADALIARLLPRWRRRLAAEHGLDLATLEETTRLLE